MSLLGTAAYADEAALPASVAAAVELARAEGFALSCRPEQGRLLALLARGVGGGVIGETGTGCGVGVAWLASGAQPAARVYSVERDQRRAEASARLFAADDSVRVITGEWQALLAHGPFDLLVLDGGGSGKNGEAVEPRLVLRIGGTLVVDDFTPSAGWPPRHEGALDRARMHWLEHPDLCATELRLADDLATVVTRRVR